MNQPKNATAKANCWKNVMAQFIEDLVSQRKVASFRFYIPTGNAQCIFGKTLDIYFPLGSSKQIAVVDQPNESLAYRTKKSCSLLMWFDKRIVLGLLIRMDKSFFSQEIHNVLTIFCF